MVAQLCKFSKNYQIVHLKWINFIVYNPYLNKAAFVLISYENFPQSYLAFSLRVWSWERSLQTFTLCERQVGWVCGFTAQPVAWGSGDTEV